MRTEIKVCKPGKYLWSICSFDFETDLKFLISWAFPVRKDAIKRDVDPCQIWVDMKTDYTGFKKLATGIISDP